jgi:coenzyme PQQ biosynthesis protein PqqD
MKKIINTDAVYGPSNDVVAREIEGEIIIVPLVSGLGDMEDELFTLNETGKAIWERLDGQKRLSDVMQELYEVFEAPAEEIAKDVIGFMEELLERGILVETSED